MNRQDPIIRLLYIVITIIALYFLVRVAFVVLWIILVFGVGVVAGFKLGQKFPNLGKRK